MLWDWLRWILSQSPFQSISLSAENLRVTKGFAGRRMCSKWLNVVIASLAAIAGLVHGAGAVDEAKPSQSDSGQQGFNPILQSQSYDPSVPAEVARKYSVNYVAAEASKNTKIEATLNSDERHRVPRLFFGPVVQPRAEKHVFEIRAPGVIAINNNTLQDSFVTQSGLVEELYVFPGEILQSGQPVLSIFSPERINAQHMYLADKAKGLGSEWLLYESSQKPQAYLQGDVDTLKWWGFTDDEIKDLSEKGQIKEMYTVRSHKSGFVTKVDSRPGGLVVAGARGEENFVLTGETILTTADFSTLWAVVYVQPQDLAYIKQGQQIQLTAAEQKIPETLQGIVDYIYRDVDPITRRASFRVLLDNKDRALMPGMYVSLRINVESESGLWIPQSAVLYGPDVKRYVITKEADGFYLNMVSIGRSEDDLVEILHGIKATDDVLKNPRAEIDPDLSTAWLWGWD